MSLQWEPERAITLDEALALVRDQCPGGQVSGIIDWGDLCMAVPAVDLAIAFSGFTGEARTALFESYGAIDAEAELRAKTFAVFSAANVAHYAHDVADPVLLAEALAGLKGAAT